MTDIDKKEELLEARLERIKKLEGITGAAACKRETSPDNACSPGAVSVVSPMLPNSPHFHHYRAPQVIPFT